MAPREDQELELSVVEKLEPIKSDSGVVEGALAFELHDDLEEEELDVDMMGGALQKLLLKFEQVSHIVQVSSEGMLNRETIPKTILDNLSGSCKPGELTVIMGPSGGGKTSLLNVLAGRIQPVAGKVSLNNEPLPKSFRRLAAYVMQDDLLPSTLTPRELFTFAANLRLAHLEPSEREQRVEFLIKTLGLRNAADTKIGDNLIRGVSGGERKRASIGYELITNPPLIFLDEPTSGLDSFTSYHLILTLRKLSRQGRTVICTIHQPSSEMFAMFDQLILLARGNMVYSGKAKDSMDYFSSINYPCPSFTNPADFFMEILHVQVPDDIQRVTKIVDAYKQREQTLVTNDADLDLHTVVEKAPKRPSILDEFIIMTTRALRMTARNPITLRARLAQNLIIAVFAGAVFVPLHDNQRSIQSRNGALFFCVMGQCMGAIMSGVLTMPLERNLLVREQATGMYRILSYFLGKTIVEVILNIFVTTIFSLVIYWFIGFVSVASKFFIFWGAINCAVFTAGSLGVLLGSAFPNAVVAVSLAPVLLLPLMLYGGLFVNLGSIGPWLYWLQFVSFFKWTYEVLLRNEYTGLTLYCDPDELVGVAPNQACPITDGSQELATLGLTFDVIYIPALITLGFGLFFRVAGFFLLRYQTRRVLNRV